MVAISVQTIADRINSASGEGVISCRGAIKCGDVRLTPESCLSPTVCGKKTAKIFCKTL